MIECQPNNRKKGSLLSLSLSLHGLLLLGAYYWPMRSLRGTPSVSHTIVLHRAPAQPAPAQATMHTPVPPTQQPISSLPQAQPTSPPVPVIAEPADTIQPTTTPAQTATTTEQTPSTIDERGLYTIREEKSTGAVLELEGWVWDTVPQPQDKTDESGKIVFEITIDALGEVIAVKTIEKTVSPLVERIYKESLTPLTFSKTVDNIASTATATGKVIFLIQAK